MHKEQAHRNKYTDTYSPINKLLCSCINDRRREHLVIIKMVRLATLLINLCITLVAAKTIPCESHTRRLASMFCYKCPNSVISFKLDFRFFYSPFHQ